ncbi:hypothetical protein [Actinophytocola sp. NPDC049390]|uniref:hypothetical protein n=1 Tax=Actinophytocola sp. NPDC049390 TaxID=3363894 RepID=UPI0037882A84
MNVDPVHAVSGARGQEWQQLHDEGVRLLQSGDVEAAAAALEAARRMTMTDDVDVEGLAWRASTLANLAALAGHQGDLDRATRLVTDAVELTAAVEREVGDRFGTTAVRANAYALRAQVAIRAGRADEAFADVDRGLTDAAVAGDDREPLTIALHNVRTGLLMVTGRLSEAQDAALATVELALAHSPELAADPYTNLALIADAVGDDEHATMYRRLAESTMDGVRPIGERWRRCVELNAQGAELVQSGDLRAAAATLDEAYRETLVPDESEDGDVEALVCRAAIAGNRAGLAATLGDFDDALRLSTESIDLAREIEARVGDEYGTTADRIGALTTRAQYLRYKSRYAEALRDLDEAAEAVPGDGPAAVSLHHVRATVLAAAGRFEEAVAAAGTALDVAGRVAPHLSPYPHMTLADIAEATGDAAVSAEHLDLARVLFATVGDANGEAAALLGLARLSYLDGQNDVADERYGAAEELFARIGNTLQLTTCLHGRAAVAVSRGEPRTALTLLDRVLDALGPDPAPIPLVATYHVQGGALEALGEFAEAEQRYRAARESSERAGLWHAALGMDWWLADALARWAATVPTEDERRELRRRSLDLALPAALAAEALRQRFAPGPMRERWVALAAAPATRAALAAIAALDDVELAGAYLDHLAAAVSLPGESAQSSGARPVRPDEVVTLPAPAPGTGPACGPHAFALPPRVRLDPDVRSVLDDWIDLAEARYALAVRSTEAVRSW